MNNRGEVTKWWETTLPGQMTHSRLWTTGNCTSSRTAMPPPPSLGPLAFRQFPLFSLILFSNMNLYSNENKHFIKLVRYFTLFLGHCYCGRTMRWINLRVQERRRLLRNSFQNIFQLLIWMDIAGLQGRKGLASHQLFCIYKVTKLFLAVIRLRPFHVLLNCKLTWQ